MIRVLTIFVAALLLWSCGGSDTDSPQNSVRTDPIGGASGTELADQQIFHKGNGAEPQTLDPHRAEGVPSSNIQRDLFEGLTSEAPDGEIIPGAAERWDISDDLKTYTFYLRSNARWSNGDPVTANDFEYSLKRSVDPVTLSRYSPILYPIVNAEAVATGKSPPETLGVKATDRLTLVIRLNAPTPYFLGLLTHSTTLPVHQPSVEAHGSQFSRAGNLISNAAYILDEWVVQSHIKLVRNSMYWDNANTTIDEVYYHAIENQDAELKRYRADELDFTYELPYSQLTWIRENLAEELAIAPYLGSYYYGFNVTRPPFKDNRNLRLALAMAIDRDIITKKVTGAGEIPAYGWIPAVTGYEQQKPEWAGWTQEQRNEEARRLYNEAGYSSDQPLEVEVLYNTSQNHKRIAVAIASMWKQTLGIKASLVNQEWKVFLETRKAKVTTEIFRAGWIGDYNDPYTFAELRLSYTQQNDTGYGNPRYDALLEQSGQEGDLHKRAELIQAAERVLNNDIVSIPIYFYVTKRLVKPWVKGYEPNILDHHYTKNIHILSR